MCNGTPAGGSVGQDHMHYDVMSEKAALLIQCILKSILHKKTANELLKTYYSSTMCMYVVSSNARDHAT